MIDAQNGRPDEKDWQALVSEIEERMATLSGALDQVWASVRHLRTLEPAFAVIEASNGAKAAFTAESTGGEIEAVNEETEAVADMDVEQSPGLMPRDSWPGTSSETLATETPEAPLVAPPVWAPSMAWASSSLDASDDAEPDPVRDEVHNLVEQARAEIASGSLTPAHDARAGDDEPSSHEEALRAEIQDMVAQARAEIAWGALKAEEPADADADALPNDDDSVRAEVTDYVEQARAELAAKGEAWRMDANPVDPARARASDNGGWANATMSSGGSMWGKPAASEAASARDEVRDLVAQAKAELGSVGLDWGSDPAQADAVLNAVDAVPAATDATDEDEEAIREEVRRVVARARADLTDTMYEDLAVSPSASEPLDEETVRHDVRRAVEEAKAEMALSSFNLKMPPTPQAQDHALDDAPEHEAGAAVTDIDDDQAARDGVRRAVEAARAEMFKSGDDLDEPREGSLVAAAREVSTALPGQAQADRWQAAVEAGAPLMPPTLVIEDSNGRVELARVYDTLNRIDCSAQASLLNYTPHSVTVGIGGQKRLPQPEVLEAAIRAVFGRGCRIVADGSRISVKIGEGERAA